ncbi:hypothetical protein QQS21_012399 [Conoideocrella luteorostrata]|uniref:Zn(2)-C6 fungal-type domain-containing protein n=1 Tax=Conoideocrella luteorostrata TaxID=1105319 RepID=A0AAJ0FSH1_9HYPO|nr:hypothetical protein QQS21_012399 [Conoideocrella luteorostrata]
MSVRSSSPESEAGSRIKSHCSGDGDGDGDGDQQPARKRQRVRLSCLECRRRKLSCDRGFPCERCIKSGTPDRCSYESRNGEVVNASCGIPPPFAQLDSRRFGIGGSDSPLSFSSREDHDRIRRLELEITQLKNILTRPGGGSFDGSTVAATDSPSTRKDENLTEGDGHPQRPDVQECIDATNISHERGELRFFRGKGFRTRYYGPHNASMAFVELTGLCPFMRETADEWLKPVILQDRKDRKRRAEDRDALFQMQDAELESLLPTREEADALVSVYLDQFEQIHRIVHIPTFRKDYAEFWKPGSKNRYAAFTALVLAMMAVASCVHTHESLKFIGMMSNARHWAEKWIKSCDSWLSRQSQKHRKLIHFQVACLLYLGKRVNTIKKKRFWTNSGALIQDGISVGLHREPSHMGGGKITVYNQEMRRRIWTTVQEFDMQASFDHGLPTLLSQLHYDTNPPRNLDDEDFDEETTALPPSKSPKDYTFCSFQNLARQSLPLRLELSRLLTGPMADIDYDQVIRHTNDLTHEIDALPSWDMKPDGSTEKKNPLIAYTLLHVQLRQYIIPLHQPYLKLRKQNSKYQYSEIIYYNAARDIVLLHDKLYEQGIRSLNFLREDALTTAINLCSVTMLQPRGSTNMIMINSHHTLKLIEKCIAMKEDRLMRCGNNEPWGYSIMCAALGLLEAHLGTKTAEVAKSTSAERFVNLHYRLLANQEAPASSENLPSTPISGATTLSVSGLGPSPGMEVPDPKSIAPFILPVDPTAAPATAWMLGAGDPAQPFNMDPSLELLGLNLNELWGESWELG